MVIPLLPWWRHQMETFSALLALCAGNSPGTSQRPVTRSLDVFLDLHLNKRPSKQPIRRWFETPSRSLWRYCNAMCYIPLYIHICAIVNIFWGVNLSQTWQSGLCYKHEWFELFLGHWPVVWEIRIYEVYLLGKSINRYNNKKGSKYFLWPL